MCARCRVVRDVGFQDLAQAGCIQHDNWSRHSRHTEPMNRSALNRTVIIGEPFTRVRPRQRIEARVLLGHRHAAIGSNDLAVERVAAAVHAYRCQRAVRRQHYVDRRLVG